MPALITHYLFGEEAVNRGLIPGLDHADLESQADSLCKAFLLGCQGPDPFFFAFATSRSAELRSMGKAMHHGRMSEAFQIVRDALRRLPDGDRLGGEAFACGLLAHYILDRAAHPYVYAMEYELCGQEGLEGAFHEVHALVESELDCGVLDLYRQMSVAEFAPVSVLEADPVAERAAGAIFAELSGRLFDLRLRPTDYACALENMRAFYRIIEPYGACRINAIGKLERVARGHSFLSALAHRTDLGARNASMNPDGYAWCDPFKGGTSTETFQQVFERALTDYRTALEAFRTGVPTARIVQRLDYSGQLLGEDELPAIEDARKPV